MTKIFVPLLCLLFLAASGFVNGSVKKEKIGIFELKKGDLSLKVTNWGASILSLVLPDKHGMLSLLFKTSNVASFVISNIFFSPLYLHYFSKFCFFHCDLSSGKLGDVVLGYDSIKDYTVSLLCTSSKTFCCIEICLLFVVSRFSYLLPA